MKNEITVVCNISGYCEYDDCEHYQPHKEAKSCKTGLCNTMGIEVRCVSPGKLGVWFYRKKTLLEME